MNAVNAIFGLLINGLIAPLSGLPAWLPLTVASLLFGMIAALAFRYTSNQAALKRVSTRVGSSLLAMRLFGDDVGVMFRAQGSLIWASIKRLLLSIPPLLFMFIPFTLVATQLAMWYEFRPLIVGENATLEVRTRPEDFDKVAAIAPQVPTGVELVGPVRSIANSAIYWDVRPTATTLGELVWDIDGQRITKALAVVGSTSTLASASPKRPGGVFWDQVLYPAESAFAATSPIQEISIAYPTRSTPIFGVNLPWWLTFLIVSILGALAIKPFVKLQF
ncbi:MAG: hypothetical protein ACKVS9_13860 [Phycisphaerae bacterium]